MDKDPHIEAMLTAHTPTLTAHEREVLWSALEKKLPPQTSIPSPYTFTFSKTKSMSALILIAVLILGGSGTTYAANAARPGDTLFPLERALENTQLRLALSDDSRNVLRTKLADERISELREILSEAARTQNSASSTTEASSTQPITHIEADIFSDRTIIKIEHTDTVRFLETDATTTDALIAFLVTKTGLTTDEIIRVLDIEQEDRASRPKDRGVALDDTSEERVEHAIEAVFAFLDDSQFDDEARAHLLESALREVDTLDVRADGARRRFEEAGVRIENNDHKKRIEIRTDSGRVRIEEKDGEVRVRTKDDSHSDSDSRDDERGNDSRMTQGSGTNDTTGSVRIDDSFEDNDSSDDSRYEDDEDSNDQDRDDSEDREDEDEWEDDDDSDDDEQEDRRGGRDDDDD